MVLGAFAGVALLLAAVGLYGVLAYRVSRQLHEIGIRMALGAGAGTVVSSVVRGGMALVVVGLAVEWLFNRLVSRYRQPICDAIGLVGRKHREKSVDQVLLEVENARRAGGWPFPYRA